jgi:hypothetical protein
LASFIRALTPSGILHDGHGLLIAHLKPGVWFYLADAEWPVPPTTRPADAERVEASPGCPYGMLVQGEDGRYRVAQSEETR